MTDEVKRKIGKLFMISVPGEELPDDVAEFCEKYHFGNFCINAKNASTLKGLCKMTSQLRAIALRTTGEYPFISIDQEGGWVTRFYEGAANIPGHMAYSASGADSAKMESVGKKLGKILRALGCNMDNAPVLDVNIDPMNPIIGTRSFSDNPEKVADLGVSFAKGLESQGVIAVVKHFPGHGNVSKDTHLTTSVNQTPADVLRKTEFVPFQTAFNEGVGGIMTAHVTFSAFGNEPATVTKEIVTDLLRGEMGFEGVVVTDSMGMNAISQAYPDGEEAIRAVEAGCNQLLYYSTKSEKACIAFEALCRAVESGRISMEMLDAACQRITDQKIKYDVASCEPDPVLAEKLVWDQNAINENFEDMCSSVTCLKNNGILEHLGEKKILCLAPVSEVFRKVEEKRRTVLSFAKLFQAEFENCTALDSAFSGLTPEVTEAINGDFDVAVVGVFNSEKMPEQLEIIKALEEKGKPVVAVLLDSPYSIRHVEGCDAVVTCYGYTLLASKATVKAMKECNYRGVLPVKM